ncbi:unannotated protein [freshwater metagenome]|uniref:Unannotated protein n=1 Tax=freshwater metagenome TaxID=449393 RepID=A0A6J6F1Q8_9ZZZZ
MKLPESKAGPNATEYPKTTQIIPTTNIAPNDIIIIFNVDLARTIPP